MKAATGPALLLLPRTIKLSGLSATDPRLQSDQIAHLLFFEEETFFPQIKTAEIFWKEIILKLLLKLGVFHFTFLNDNGGVVEGELFPEKRFSCQPASNGALKIEIKRLRLRGVA